MGEFNVAQNSGSRGKRRMRALRSLEGGGWAAWKSSSSSFVGSGRGLPKSMGTDAPRRSTPMIRLQFCRRSTRNAMGHLLPATEK
jgi:hypothetical protein